MQTTRLWIAKGMTLIEVMLAFAILTAGLLSIFAMLQTGLKSHQRAIQETEAAFAAASILAELRSEFACGRVPSFGKNDYRRCEDYPGYQYTAQIVPMQPKRLEPEWRELMRTAGELEYFVRVEVRWAERGDKKSLNIQTIMARRDEINRKDLER